MGLKQDTRQRAIFESDPLKFPDLSPELVNGQRKFFDLLSEVLPRQINAALPAREFELRYLIRLADLKDVLRRDLDQQHIKQFYLPDELVQLSSWFVFRAYGKTADLQNHKIVRARLRSFEGQEDTYNLNIKGQKKIFGGRLDVPLPIDFMSYSRLTPFASAGYASKQRLCVEGSVAAGQQAEAHIDLLSSSADGSKFIKPGVVLINGREYAFAIVEIEVNCDDELRAVMAGQHSFGFLRSAIPLWEQSGEVQDAFSSSRLADPRYGFDKKVRQTLQDLLG